MKRQTIILLLWIAAGLVMMVPGMGLLPDSGCCPPTMMARSRLLSIESGIRCYQIATDHYPLMSKAGGQRVETKGPWLDCLLGRNPDGADPAGIEDLGLHEDYDGRDGLLEATASRGETQLVDHWGHPYVILFSADPESIANPDVKNTSSRVRSVAPATLSRPFVMFSLGPDGIEGTHDDIVSWRRAIPSLGDDLRQAGGIAIAFITLAVLFTACWQFFRLVQDALVTFVWRETP